MTFFTLWLRHRALLLEMTRREIVDRFAGSHLGAVWSILHPLLLMAVYVVVFTHVFKARAPEGAPDGMNYAILVMSAYLPWMVLADVCVRSCSSVSERGNLVKQVVFPVQVLPAKTVLAAMLPEFVGLVFLLVYSLSQAGGLPLTWLLVPPLLVLQFMVLSGVALLLSSVGVYLRDLRELAAVAMMVGLYVAPVLYTEEMAPPWLGHWLALNPASYMVWPFRDACYAGRMAHPEAWIVMVVAAIAMPFLGGRVFARLRPHFANAL